MLVGRGALLNDGLWALLPLMAFLAASSVVIYWVPKVSAAGYVEWSLKQDMRDPFEHYLCGGNGSKKGASCFWVALEGDTVIGCVAVEPPAGKDPKAPWIALQHRQHGEQSDDGVKEAELRRMSVAASHRGRGVAKALIATLMAFCRQQGYSRVVLSTSSNQRAALQMYPKLGFRLVKQAFIVKPLCCGLLSTNLGIHYFCLGL